MPGFEFLCSACLYLLVAFLASSHVVKIAVLDPFRTAQKEFPSDMKFCNDSSSSRSEMDSSYAC